jgi:hypothetical protein
MAMKDIQPEAALAVKAALAGTAGKALRSGKRISVSQNGGQEEPYESRDSRTDLSLDRSGPLLKIRRRERPEN